MDWSEISKALSQAAKLGGTAREDYFKTLDEQRTGLGAQVRAAMARQTLGQSFMQTSVPDAVDPADDRFAPGEQVGVWEILDCVGAGGMGEVYKAVRADGRYEQTVALKIMRSDDPRRRERFEQERQRLAALDHPGISRIIDGGETPEGRAFMAMEFVEGAPINAYVRGRSLKRREILKLFLQLCEAVRHAHNRLILHRDIKADNVLVDENGRVRLIDFGVASLLDDPDGDPAGPLTLAYAAPEQLSGQTLSVGTDIFAMGVILHEVIFGELPQRNPDGTMSLTAPGPKDREIHAVTAKMLAADPADRYSSADAAAEDIEALLGGRPVLVHRTDWLYRTGKTIKRYPLASGLAAAFIAALAGGIILTSSYAQRAQTEAARAVDALERSEFFLERAESNNRILEAYGDALHRAFGQKNAEEVKEILLGRVEAAYANQDASPDQAAEAILAIGRNFVERNDYATAAEILRPWVEAGFGDERLRVRGQFNLAIAENFSGSIEAAQALYHEVDDAMTGTRDENSHHHLTTMVLLNNIERDPDRQERLAAALTEAAEKGGRVEEQIFYRYYLQSFARRDGDFDLASRYASELVDLMEANPLTEVSGQDTIRINKAMYDLYHHRDVDAAQAQIDIVLDELLVAKGESLANAHALDMRGVIHVMRDDPDAALEDFETALEVALRYTGEGSSAHATASASLAEVLALRGDFDAAREVLDKFVSAAGAESASRYNDIVLATAYIETLQNGPQAGRSALQAAEFDPARTQNHVIRTFRLDRLRELGVEI